VLAAFLVKGNLRAMEILNSKIHSAVESDIRTVFRGVTLGDES
jgi:hypothetical protein